MGEVDSGCLAGFRHVGGGLRSARHVVFGLGEVDDDVWWFRRWWTRAGGTGGPFLSPVTSGGRR